MNKQKLIGKMESQAERYSEKGAWPHIDTWNAYVRAIGWARELDEPQQPVVPKFVAEWYEKNKKDLHDKLFCEIATAGNVSEETTEFQHWLFNTPNCMNIVLNMKNGYKVEKEPLYHVKINGRYLAKMSNFSDVVILVSEDEVSECATESYELTEKQIKAIDERYWPFAVPVKEVAEG